MDWFLHCISWKHAPAHVKQSESAGKTWIYQLPATSDTCQQINLTGKMLLLILFLHTNTLQACALIFGCDSSPRSPNVSLFVCHTCLIWRLVPDVSWQKWSSILICQNCFFYIQRLHQAWSWCWDLRLFFTRTRIRERSEVYLCAQMKWILKILLNLNFYQISCLKWYFV